MSHRVDKTEFDTKGNPIRNPKMVACQCQVSKNENEIMELGTAKQKLKNTVYGVDPIVYRFLKRMGFDAEKEATELEKEVRENNKKVNALQKTNGAIKKCIGVNWGNYNAACNACKNRPSDDSEVKEYPRAEK